MSSYDEVKYLDHLPYKRRLAIECIKELQTWQCLIVLETVHTLSLMMQYHLFDHIITKILWNSTNLCVTFSLLCLLLLFINISW